jgi:hypothetical protein
MKWTGLAPVLCALAMTAVCPAPAIAADITGPDGIDYPDFTRAGVPGGIPQVPVVIDATTLGATPDDGNDDSAAIQAAVLVASAQGGGAVLLPAGEYHLDRTVVIDRDNVVIRGADPQRTIIRPRFADEPLTGPSPARAAFRFEGPRHPRRVDLSVTRPIWRGDTVVHVEQAGRLEVGNVVTVVARPPAQAIDLLTPVLKGLATDGSWGSIYSWQYARVVRLGEDQVELDRPVRLDLALEQNPQVIMHNQLLDGVGLENLTIEQEEEKLGINGVRFFATQRSWMKNVTVRRIGNSPMSWGRSFEFEMRDCELDDMRARGGAVGYFSINFSSDGLVADSTIRRLRHLSISMASNGIVLHRCRLSNVDINFHMHWPYENLVDACEVDVTAEADSGESRGTYNWAIYTPRHTGDMHNPAGPRNTFFNSRYVSVKDGMFLGGGATHHTIVAYNHFISRGGSAAIIQEGSDDTVLIGNVFVLENPGQTAEGTQWRVPSRTVEELIGGVILAAEVPGLRLIGNTFTGIDEDQVLLHGEAAEKRDNTVTGSTPERIETFAESLLDWQREQR